MSRFRFNQSIKKKTALLFGMLALIISVGVLSDKLAGDRPLETSMDYVEYEQGKLDEHDGQVLVDSISISTLPGKAPDSADATDVFVVTSDDLESISDITAYLKEVRATIDMDRSEIISMLSEVIAETNDGAEKNNATQQKLKIIEYMNAEKAMENLIENKGFTDALVIMTDSSVNITVNKQNLSQSDIAKITDIVIRETNRKADQIVIQSKF
jgi:stage III sporulation protein AH